MEPKSNTVPGLAGFLNIDIGSPRLAGSARHVETGWDLIAGGADIWEKSDQFHFVYKHLSGDFDIAVRVESFTPAHLYSKAGLMVRETLNADSPHLTFLVFSDNSPRNNNLGASHLLTRERSIVGCEELSWGDFGWQDRVAHSKSILCRKRNCPCSRPVRRI